MALQQPSRDPTNGDFFFTQLMNDSEYESPQPPTTHTREFVSVLDVRVAPWVQICVPSLYQLYHGMGE